MKDINDKSDVCLAIQLKFNRMRNEQSAALARARTQNMWQFWYVDRNVYSNERIISKCMDALMPMPTSMPMQK